MKIFITGGSGFIGKNLIEYLENKHTIIAPGHRELDLLDTEKVEDFFEREKIDIVIHCAVRPGHRNATDPSGQLLHNTRMFFNIARNEKKFKKMIYLGSGLEYDKRFYQPKMKEEYFDQHVPEDEGGFSKYIISKYIKESRNIIEFRIFGIFGKYEDYTIRFISNMICKTLYDLPLTMHQNRKFDYIYIDDLMPIIDHFIYNEPKEHNIFNITPDSSVELSHLAERVKEISKRIDLPIVVAEHNLGLEYSGDNTRLKREIPDLAFTSMEESIKDLYAWYKKNIDLTNKDLLLEDK